MEALDKLGKGLLWPWLDFQQADTSLPFLTAGNELANKFVSHILETSYAPRWQTIQL